MGHARRDPDFERRTRESFARQGAMALIGARLEKVEPGLVEIGLDYRAEPGQQHGFFHAGMLSAIADTAGRYAGFTLFAADGEHAHAVGRVIRSGRTLTVCQLEVYVDKGARKSHCATGLQTLMSLVGRAGVRD
ncbi:MAG TPA: PaaI family thioesterase [Usitatibacter sp.]|jgi:acyl-coenzyme A thioesterase PaaI-like protein|nr:PaaI family thioesterase [Usitatibacter sp.]